MQSTHRFWIVRTAIVAVLTLAALSIPFARSAHAAPAGHAAPARPQAHAMPLNAQLGGCTDASQGIFDIPNYAVFAAWSWDEGYACGNDGGNGVYVEGSTNGYTWGSGCGSCSFVRITNAYSLPGTGIALQYLRPNLIVAGVGANGTSKYHIWVGKYNDTSTLQNVVILGATSYVTPALAYYGGLLYLTWTGTDSRLNFLQSADGINWYNQAIVSDTSSSGPGFTQFNGSCGDALYVAWAGTDSNNTVNIGAYTNNTFLACKKTLWGTADSGSMGLTWYNYSNSSGPALDMIGDFEFGEYGVYLAASHDSQAWNFNPPYAVKLTSGAGYGASDAVLNSSCVIGAWAQGIYPNVWVSECASPPVKY